MTHFATSSLKYVNQYYNLKLDMFNIVFKYLQLNTNQKAELTLKQILKYLKN